MKKLVRLALAFASLSSGSALAGTHQFTIENNARLPVTRVHVFEGETADFERIPPTERGTFKVILPDGVCRATIRITIRNNQFLDAANHNFCTAGGIVIGGGGVR